MKDGNSPDLNRIPAALAFCGRIEFHPIQTSFPRPNRHREGGMKSIAFLLCVLPAAAQDVDELLRALDSDDPQIRDDATREFISRWNDDGVRSRLQAERARAGKAESAEV